MLREEPKINYPWEAIRELAMNSVMHRAYNGNNSPIEFYEYSDRIEIDNPGNLYGKVNLENFPNETDYRNPNIAEIMANLGYVNRFGSGVNTLYALLEGNGNRPATFLLGDMTTFKVVVANADVIENDANVIEKAPDVIVNIIETDTKNGTNDTNNGTNTNSREDMIVELMRKNKRISVTEISKQLGIPRRTLFRIIDLLKESNRIKRVGSLKAGTWEVI